MIREPVAVTSWLGVAAVSFLPDKMRSQTPGVDICLTTTAFFIAAAATRYWLQETRTREQILAFVVVAAVVAILRGRPTGRTRSIARMLAGAGGAAAGALVVKFGLEGLPF